MASYPLRPITYDGSRPDALERIDDVLADWDGSLDAARWDPDNLDGPDGVLDERDDLDDCHDPSPTGYTTVVVVAVVDPYPWHPRRDDA